MCLLRYDIDVMVCFEPVEYMREMTRPDFCLSSRLCNRLKGHLLMYVYKLINWFS